MRRILLRCMTILKTILLYYAKSAKSAKSAKCVNGVKLKHRFHGSLVRMTNGILYFGAVALAA